MTPLPYRRNVGAMLFSRDGLVLVARRAHVPHAEAAKGGPLVVSAKGGPFAVSATGGPFAVPATGAWQLPQGGIDEHEEPRAAVFRELTEEIGTAHAEILAEHPDWLSYDLPPELIGKAFKGRYRGQTQKWFALRFLGEDSEIRLDADPHPEFDAWRWAEISELPGLAVAFKRPIYEVLARDFARFSK